MSQLSEGGSDGAMEPDLDQARQSALVAHNVIVKLKEMGLPGGFDEELATMSTDLGDLWGAQKALADRLDEFLRTPTDWEAVGDSLLDLRAILDHMGWHAKSARRPMSRVVRFAYKQASESRSAPVT